LASVPQCAEGEYHAGDRFGVWDDAEAHARNGDDPAVRRRDGPDRARDERSVADAVTRWST